MIKNKFIPKLFNLNDILFKLYKNDLNDIYESDGEDIFEYSQDVQKKLEKHEDE